MWGVVHVPGGQDPGLCNRFSSSVLTDRLGPKNPWPAVDLL